MASPAGSRPPVRGVFVRRDKDRRAPMARMYNDRAAELDRMYRRQRLPRRPPRRRLASAMRIVVLGAGICGLFGGLLLARDGHEVTLVERDPAPVPDVPVDAWDAW